MSLVSPMHRVLYPTEGFPWIPRSQLPSALASRIVSGWVPVGLGGSPNPTNIGGFGVFEVYWDVLLVLSNWIITPVLVGCESP